MAASSAEAEGEVDEWEVDRSTRVRHGDWLCPACGNHSPVNYRCKGPDGCGHDLAGNTTTAGRERRS